MTSENIRNVLASAARRAWPGAGRASDLPFPAYWKGAMEWLCFHAPHVGDRLMGEFIAEIVREAAVAEKAGCEPKTMTVPEEVREIWQQGRGKREEGRGVICGGGDGAWRRGQARGGLLQQGQAHGASAWENAAERVQAVKDRFEKRLVQGRLI